MTACGEDAAADKADAAAIDAEPTHACAIGGPARVQRRRRL